MTDHHPIWKEARRIPFDVQGTYRNRPLSGLVVVSPKPGVNTVTILVHGVYGVTSPDDPREKSIRLAQKLVASGVSHAVLYNSSRDFVFDDDMDYAARQEAFKDKTFAEELEDLRRVIAYVRERSQAEFGIAPKDLKLYLHGNSLGGTIIVTSVKDIPGVEKVSLCGSGCGTNGSTKPILSTMYDEVAILAGITDYTGELQLLQGSADTVVPRESGWKIIQHATKTHAKVIVVPGANHNFSKLNGVSSQEAETIWVDTIYAFLAG
jgi:dienelactone hydrolase